MVLCVWTQNYVPCFEVNLNSLVSNVLGKSHIKSIICFHKLEARLIQECLNVFQLRVILILILDLSIEGLLQLLRGLLNSLKR